MARREREPGRDRQFASKTRRKIEKSRVLVRTGMWRRHGKAAAMRIPSGYSLPHTGRIGGGLADTLCSGFLQEFCSEHEALHLLDPALDLVFVVGEVDVLDQGPSFQHNGRPFNLQVLDEGDGVAFRKEGSIAVSDVHGNAFMSVAMG